MQEHSGSSAIPAIIMKKDRFCAKNAEKLHEEIQRLQERSEAQLYEEIQKLRKEAMSSCMKKGGGSTKKAEKVYGNPWRLTPFHVYDRK